MKRQIWVLLVLSALVPFLLGAAQSMWGTYAGFPVAKLVVNGEEVEGDVPSLVVNGRTLVPLRLGGEALGARVGWDGASMTATLETASRPASGLDYSDWTLTPDEVMDAVKWAESGKAFGWWELLPMYQIELANGWLDLYTPWGQVVIEAHRQYTDERALKWSTEDFINHYSGKLVVRVWYGTSASLHNEAEVTVRQGNTTFLPVDSTKPEYEVWWDGGFGFIQTFYFDASPLDHTAALFVTLKVTDRPTQERVWNLWELK